MKSFDAIIGHKKIISHFEEAIKTGKVSHAYLLSGEDGSGKMMIAKAVAKALLCEHKDGCGECAACKQVDSLNHPDVIYITHEKYEIRVDDIRKGINETIDIKPYSGDYKIYIIDDADRMNAGAQNALLKTLEEPPAYTGKSFYAQFAELAPLMSSDQLEQLKSEILCQQDRKSVV